MTPNPDPDPDSPSTSELHALVCGRCEKILQERYESPAAMDRAADEHALRQHPDERVLVLPVKAQDADERPDEIIQAAARMQADIDHDGTPRAA